MNISTISPTKFDTGKSVTLSGTGFGSSQGTVTIGGQAQTVTSWSDEEIVFTSVRGAQSMGACRVDVVATEENPPNPVYPYSVYPILSGGIFDNDVIPNTLAKWRVVSADSETRWEWFDGGGYTFDATGATAGAYTATYEVENWDGLGNNASATVTVTVTV